LEAALRTPDEMFWHKLLASSLPKEEHKLVWINWETPLVTREGISASFGILLISNESSDAATWAFTGALAGVESGGGTELSESSFLSLLLKILKIPVPSSLLPNMFSNNGTGTAVVKLINKQKKNINFYYLIFIVNFITLL
jgi:hypothetical protein